jgi:hypothetical protein
MNRPFADAASVFHGSHTTMARHAKKSLEQHRSTKRNVNCWPGFRGSETALEVPSFQTARFTVVIGKDHDGDAGAAMSFRSPTFDGLPVEVATSDGIEQVSHRRSSAAASPTRGEFEAS